MTSFSHSTVARTTQRTQENTSLTFTSLLKNTTQEKSNGRDVSGKHGGGAWGFQALSGHRVLPAAARGHQPRSTHAQSFRDFYGGSAMFMDLSSTWWSHHHLLNKALYALDLKCQPDDQVTFWNVVSSVSGIYTIIYTLKYY